MDEERQDVLDEELRDWRLSELHRLGYDYPERCQLIILIEHGELELEAVRRIAELGATPEEAWAVLV